VNRVRDYHYLSATKITQRYLQQAPPPKMTKEWSVDLKMAAFTSRPTGAEPTIYQQLEAVEDRIYAREQVGTIDEPEPWIWGRGRLHVSYVDPFAAWDPAQVPITGDRAAVVFGTQTDDGQALVMVGSAHHLTAQNPRGEQVPQMPNWSSLINIRRLLKHYAQPLELRTFSHDTLTDIAPPDPRRLGSDVVQDGVEGVLEYFADSPANGVDLGECEYLARQLDSRQANSGVTTTLATPLFVALAA
jgi:hypothetical protein